MGFDSAGETPYYDNPRDLNARNYTMVKLYKGENEFSYVKKNCMHCNDPACVAACPVTALVKRDDGPVTYDPDRCIGCRYCMIACPFDIPKFEYYSATPEIRKCDLCWDIITDESKPEEQRKTVCSEVCPRDAIITGRRKDLIAEGWRRINAKPDKYVHHVYGEYEVGGTAVVYIAAVEHEKLGFQPFNSASVTTMPTAIQHGIFKYWVTPLALFGMLAITRGSQLRCDPNEDEDCIEV
jgi:Fe-S-cluster-containing dehydrogenase component